MNHPENARSRFRSHSWNRILVSRTKILEITGNAPDLKAKITFDHYGEKLLLLKYAKMRVL